MLRILTLFLSLLLTLLPESVGVVSYFPGQDVFLEEVTDVEEEAVVRTQECVQEQMQASSRASDRDSFTCNLSNNSFQTVHYCFERQWLRYCRLLL